MPLSHESSVVRFFVLDGSQTLIDCQTSRTIVGLLECPEQFIKTNGENRLSALSNKRAENLIKEFNLTEPQ
jgi:hypothetical protein